MRSNFGTYQDKYIPTPDAYSCGSTQAFGVDPYSNYVYSVKINGSDTKAIIYRANRNSKSSAVVLKNGDNNSYTNPYLGHANDMCVTNINGRTILYITTSSSKFTNHFNIMAYEIVGNTYYLYAAYNVKIGPNYNASGIAVTDHNYDNNTKVRFILKNGNEIYSFIINKSDSSINQYPTNVFTLSRDVVRLTRNDTNVTEYKNVDANHFNAQGIDYCKENDTLYFTLGGKANKSESIVLTYKGTYARLNLHFVGAPLSRTLKPLGSLTFYITSKTYAPMFELEGTGIAPGGKLFFNANRRKTTGIDYDVISYIKTYDAY